MSPQGHNKAAATYRASLFEKDPETSRTALPGLKIQRKSHIEKTGEAEVWSGWDLRPGTATHRKEGSYRAGVILCCT